MFHHTFFSALALVALAIADSEPHFLRIKNSVGEHEGDDNCANGGIDCKGKGKFSVEKGMKCEGGFNMRGKGKKCEGGMKSEFHIGHDSAKDIAEEVSSALFEQVHNMFPEKHNLLPSDDAMEAMMAFDNPELIQDVEEGMSKTIEFGGFVKAGWGCKVTYEKIGGKFSKKAECGFSGFAGEGLKPDLFSGEE